MVRVANPTSVGRRAGAPCAESRAEGQSRITRLVVGTWRSGARACSRARAEQTLTRTTQLWVTRATLPDGKSAAQRSSAGRTRRDRSARDSPPWGRRVAGARCQSSQAPGSRRSSSSRERPAQSPRSSSRRSTSSRCCRLRSWQRRRARNPVRLRPEETTAEKGTDSRLRARSQDSCSPRRESGTSNVP